MTQTPVKAITMPTAATFLTCSFMMKCETEATKIGCDVTSMTDVETRVRLSETIQRPKWNERATPLRRTMAHSSFRNERMVLWPPV